MPGEGVEPPRPRAAGFKPAASTGSATPARVRLRRARSIARPQLALRELLGRVVAERLPERVRGLLVEARALRPLRPRGEGHLVAELRERRDHDRVRVLLVPGGQTRD